MAVERIDQVKPSNTDRIRQPMFESARKGFDRAQVMGYVRTVSDLVRSLEEQIAWLQSQAAASKASASEGQEQGDPLGTQDPYEQVAGRMADVLRTLDQESERLRAEAEAEARQVLDDARREADHILQDALGRAEGIRAQAERMEREARETSERALADLTGRRQSMLAELRAVRERLLETAEALETGPEASTDHRPTGQVTIEQEALNGGLK